jgi:hypothetical protein
MVMQCQKLDLWHDDAGRFLDGAERSILRNLGLSAVGTAESSEGLCRRCSPSHLSLVREVADREGDIERLAPFVILKRHMHR